MSSYSIPHGSTRDSSSLTYSSIQTNREMKQLCGVTETVSKVPDIEDTIKFLLDTKKFVYTVDMFRDTLQLLVETPKNPFVAAANIHTIEAFMNRVGYQGVVDKVSAFFTKNLAQPWIEEDYHSIKDDIPLIRETNDFKEYETVFMKVAILMNQPQPVVSTHGTNRNTPRAHRSPTVYANPLEMKKRKQTARESSSPRKSLKITIKQRQTFEKDDDDSEDRIEPGIHKDNPEFVNDDDDDKVEEKQSDDMGSFEIRNEEAQITIPTPLSSPRKILSSDKKTYQELTDIVSVLTTTTSKHSQVKKRISSKYSHLPSAIRRMEDDFHSQHDEHQDDDAPPEGEKRAKRGKGSKRSKSIRDEVIPEDETHELIAEFQNVDKRVPAIFDRARMEATLRDSLNNQTRNAKEYAYHLKQSTNFMENQIYGNTEERKYILSLHKIHAEEFPEPDLEETLNRWVRKEFKTFNEDARLSIQHWKDSWHKRVYKQNQKKVKKNPKDYYSNHRITEVVRIITDQPHGLDFMEQILVMRDNDKPYSFFEADFKYLNQNDIEDLYY
ncbi:hypothetical protein Tco_1257541 [Tanacetum coccineum]